MFVARIDGCRGGWVSFKVDLTSLATSVELIDVPSILRNKPDDLAICAIDIPVGLLDGSRVCDKAARKLLGQPRGTSLLSGLTFYNGLSATPHLVENDVCGCFPFKRLGFIVPVGEPLIDRTFQFIYAMEGPAADHAVRDEPE